MQLQPYHEEGGLISPTSSPWPCWAMRYTYSSASSSDIKARVCKIESSASHGCCRYLDGTVSPDASVVNGDSDQPLAFHPRDIRYLNGDMLCQQQLLCCGNVTQHLVIDELAMSGTKLTVPSNGR